mgnify:CR=1 FL=1
MKAFPFWDPYTVKEGVSNAMLDAACEHGVYLANQLEPDQAHQVAEELRGSDWYKNREVNNSDSEVNEEKRLTQYEQDKALIMTWSVDAATEDEVDIQ